MSEAIPPEKKVGGYNVVTTPALGMSSVTKQGMLTAENVVSFNVGDDGCETLRDCYDKAIEYAENH